MSNYTVTQQDTERLPPPIRGPVRPVLSRDDAVAIGQKILELSHTDTVSIEIVHHAYGVTRVSPRRTRSARDGETVILTISTRFGDKGSVTLSTNQLDDSTLKMLVPYLEQIAMMRLGSLIRTSAPIILGPQSYLPITLWHDKTVDALVEERTSILMSILDATANAALQSAVFIGASARATCIMRKDGLIAYGEETDSELTVTCWTSDWNGSGWGGSAARNWKDIDPLGAAHHAINIARRSININALEPGRRTVILGPAAVAQLVRKMAYAFDARDTFLGHPGTPFSKTSQLSRVGERVFDQRVSMRSDPNDPDGGYLPFFSNGLPQGPIQWVKNGELKSLAYSPFFGASRGVTNIADIPRSVRLEYNTGLTATVEQMIAECKEGVYINRLSNVDVEDWLTGVMSGVTRDGCFFVRNGKIERPIKNFRFRESPWFFLNQLEMIGPTHRVALGYVPTVDPWPLPPIVVPPMMIRDFNLVALADAI